MQFLSLTINNFPKQSKIKMTFFKIVEIRFSFLQQRVWLKHEFNFKQIKNFEKKFDKFHILNK